MPLIKAHKASCDRCGATRLIDTQSLREAEQQVVDLGWQHNPDDTLLCANCVYQENREKQIRAALRGDYDSR